MPGLIPDNNFIINLYKLSMLKITAFYNFIQINDVKNKTQFFTH